MPGITTSDSLHVRNLTADEQLNLSGSQAVTAVVNGSIIPSTTSTARVTLAGAATGVIVQAGVTHGQILTIFNESAAANTATMAASGTSNVAAGATAVLSGLAAHVLMWNAGTSLWYQVGPASN